MQGALTLDDGDVYNEWNNLRNAITSALLVVASLYEIIAGFVNGTQSKCYTFSAMSCRFLGYMYEATVVSMGSLLNQM